METSLYKQAGKPHGSFELDEAGTVDTEGKATEALVYTIEEKVINPNPDPDKGESEYFAC